MRSNVVPKLKGPPSEESFTEILMVQREKLAGSGRRSLNVFGPKSLSPETVQIGSCRPQSFVVSNWVQRYRSSHLRHSGLRTSSQFFWKIKSPAHYSAMEIPGRPGRPSTQNRRGPRLTGSSRAFPRLLPRRQNARHFLLRRWSVKTSGDDQAIASAHVVEDDQERLKNLAAEFHAALMGGLRPANKTTSRAQYSLNAAVWV